MIDIQSRRSTLESERNQVQAEIATREQEFRRIATAHQVATQELLRTLIGIEAQIQLCLEIEAEFPPEEQ